MLESVANTNHTKELQIEIGIGIGIGIFYFSNQSTYLTMKIYRYVIRHNVTD